MTVTSNISKVNVTTAIVPDIVVAKDGSGDYTNIMAGINAADAGDIVGVKTGTYNERIVFPDSGSAGNYITLSAYPGHIPTISGTNVIIDGDSRAGLVQISNKNWIRIVGFKITDSLKSGIRMLGTQNTVIQDNYVNARQCAILNGYGIQSKNITIDRNICERTYPFLSCSPGTNIQEVISMDYVDNLEIAYNQVLGNTCGEGIDAKNGCTNVKIHHNSSQNTDVGIYIDGSTRDTYNLEVYSNITKNNRISGIKLGDEAGGKLKYVKVYNNASYGNKYAGIVLDPSVYNNIVDASVIEDIEIYHNTVYNNGYGTLYPSGGIFLIPQRENDLKRWNRINVYRNIVSNNNRFQIIAQNQDPYVKNITVDQNFIQGYRSNPAETRGTNYVEGDPMFVDANNENFRLLSGSPAVGYGVQY